MKTTALFVGAIALSAVVVTPAMARLTRPQIATAKRCQAMTHRAMTRDKSCAAMARSMKKTDVAHAGTKK